MSDIQRISDLTARLNETIDSKDLELMATRFEDLEKAYDEEFKDKLKSQNDFIPFLRMQYAFVRYLAFGNFYKKAHELADDLNKRVTAYLSDKKVKQELKLEVSKIWADIQGVVKGLKKAHANQTIDRKDSRCCLCRKRIANKTGAHMVPNFLAHPTFATSEKGKRGKEALDAFYANCVNKNSSFYGQNVNPERIEQGLGHPIPEAFADTNINRLEYDNEFCSVCEDRWGILETAYSSYYSGTSKSISPRLSYLFWLSVIYRMSLGRMGIYLRTRDDLDLRKILDSAILDSTQKIIDDSSDLGSWKYAMFRATGLAKEGDKGILGSDEHYPYVIMINDLILVFYSSNPTDEQLLVGPIKVDRGMLNDWSSPEKAINVNRRFFWDVRDWIVETHQKNYDPPREEALLLLREEERHADREIADNEKRDLLIKVARLAHPALGRRVVFRKLYRFFIADMRRKEAEARGESYDILADEDLFLSEKNIADYYSDLSEGAQCGYDVSNFPFYAEARKEIPDENKWKACKKAPIPREEEYENTMNWYLNELLDGPAREQQLREMGLADLNDDIGYRSLKIGRNDPCPCGSGKKYKKCHGR